MTTEVLRNMLYADSDLLEGLGFVVMDEVHYLADRLRGPVWEEVIIHLDRSVQLVSLSATVSNAEEFGAWLQEVRGSTDIIVSETRPVPLWQHVIVGDELLDLFVDADGEAVVSQGPGARSDRQVNPQIERITSFSLPVDERSGGRAARGIGGAGAPAGVTARGAPGSTGRRTGARGAVAVGTPAMTHVATIIGRVPAAAPTPGRPGRGPAADASAGGGGAAR
ncbi:DEAD/DEAH box helicase [Brachybacterium sp. Z12]|uniref:DEAD/DEAH box helicase n=1 Tax=Brachybacterium sp. Z12 TaxID=2759167 RepID=UPI0037BE4A51